MEAIDLAEVIMDALRLLRDGPRCVVDTGFEDSTISVRMNETTFVVTVAKVAD